MHGLVFACALLNGAVQASRSGYVWGGVRGRGRQGCTVIGARHEHRSPCGVCGHTVHNLLFFHKMRNKPSKIVAEITMVVVVSWYAIKHKQNKTLQMVVPQ